MPENVDFKKLDEAAEALKRASRAAWLAQQWPHSQMFPCKAQREAAVAEIHCAEQLLIEAQEPRK